MVLPTIRRVLVIRLRELGDTLLSTPLLRQLSRIHTDVQIDVLCEPRNRVLLAHNHNIRSLIELPRKASVAHFLALAIKLRAIHYDLVVDCQSLPKSALLTRLTGAPKRLGFKNRWLRNRLCYTHPFQRVPLRYTALSNLLLLQDHRIDPHDLSLEFPVDTRMEAIADQIQAMANGRELIAINPMTRFCRRRWPLEHFAEICNRLTEIGKIPLILYGPNEQDIAIRLASLIHSRCLVDYPMLDLQQLRAVLSRCELYVGNDGGPRHIAIAAGTPTVAVFGDSPDPWTPPNNLRHLAIASAACGQSIKSAGEVIPEAPNIQAIPVAPVWSQVCQSLERFKKQAA